MGKIKPFRGPQPPPPNGGVRDTTIKFTVKNGQASVSYTNPVSITDMFQIVFTGLLAGMNATVASCPEDQQVQAKEDLYDMLNAAASNTLAYFAPEIEMRPHLTADAILEAENAIIERNAKALKAARKQNS